MFADLESFARDLAFGPSAPDWLRLLRAYRWRGTDWTCGVLTRQRFRDEWLNIQRTCGNNHAMPKLFRRWADEITFDWGGIHKRIEDVDLQRVWLDMRGASFDKPEFFGEAHVSIARLYAMSDPKEWANYDGRVARALQELTRQRFLRDAEIPVSFLFCAPLPDVVDDAPPEFVDPRFPRIASGQEFRASFVKASALICTVAAILRHEGGQQPGAVLAPGEKRGDDRWQLWHIEMALFMLGKRDREDDE